MFNAVQWDFLTQHSAMKSHKMFSLSYLSSLTQCPVLFTQGSRLRKMASRRIIGFLETSKVKFNFTSILSRNLHDVTSDTAKKVTHTGQLYDENDYRNARFVDRPKEVNDNWAIKLIAEVPPKPAKDRIVACNGGGGPLGHPKVYINLDKPGDHTCGYCGLRFYKEDGH
ncbi:NADH dehydrogenase (ubiquinone) 13 kDa A subunit [Nomia melanderi]|uniref:NADH dehydrogenase (ubiquinone) 13 kDa A subunit n=1 Tax=Nomia melanderi TaxID=2448451 RepID=UPI0013044D7E|nr:NADH dehydrogenase [ubiquinone] iron-sulfur protein 6, mitochondrial [Nomia melanderi]